MVALPHIRQWHCQSASKSPYPLLLSASRSRIAGPTDAQKAVGIRRLLTPDPPRIILIVLVASTAALRRLLHRIRHFWALLRRFPSLGDGPLIESAVAALAASHNRLIFLIRLTAPPASEAPTQPCTLRLSFAGRINGRTADLPGRQ